MQSGEGGPRAIQHISPLMIQFVDDEKENNERESYGTKKRKGHREEPGRIMDREKRTNEVTNVTVWDEQYCTGRNEGCSFYFHEKLYRLYLPYISSLDIGRLFLPFWGF